MDTHFHGNDHLQPHHEPQVTVKQITLPDGTQQTHVESNIAIVPGVWSMIAGFLLQGVQAALEAHVRENMAPQDTPLIAIPSLGISQKKIIM